MSKKQTKLFRSNINVNDLPKHKHEEQGPDLCVPDRAYSIQELFDRYNAGMPLPQEHPGIYNDDANFDTDTTLYEPDFDLSDIDTLVDKEREQLIRKANEEVEEDEEVITKKEPEENEEDDTPDNEDDVT